MPAPPAQNGCGTKHVKLACWLIGLMLAVTVAVVQIGLSGTRDLESRVRVVETGQAATIAELKSIQDGQRRIERKLDKLDERSRP